MAPSPIARSTALSLAAAVLLLAPAASADAARPLQIAAAPQTLPDETVARAAAVRRALAPSARATPIEIEGLVTSEGGDCPTVRGRDGGLYSLAAGGALDAKPGDFVRVTGAVADIVRCGAGTTVAVRAVEEMEPPSGGTMEPDGRFFLVGILTGEGGGCRTLRTYGGELWNLSGDLEGNAVGQPVTVVGKRVASEGCDGSLTLSVDRIDALELAQARIGDVVSR